MERHATMSPLGLRPWLPFLGLLVGTVLLGRACAIDRDLAFAPLRIDAARLQQQPLDTNIVLPRSASYQLILALEGTSGDDRRRLFPAPPLVEFDGAIGGRPWSTGESGATGTNSSGRLYLGTASGQRGEVLRLTLRATPGLAEWLAYSPELSLRLDYRDTITAPIERGILQLLAWAIFAISAFGALAYWRMHRRWRAQQG
jgi:hypothetical protein